MAGGHGLQPQRTVLAWTRTGIGCGGLAALLIRHAAITGRPVDAVAAAVVAGAAATVLLLGRLRRTRPFSHRYVVTTTVLVGAAGIAVLVSVVTG